MEEIAKYIWSDESLKMLDEKTANVGVIERVITITKWVAYHADWDTEPELLSMAEDIIKRIKK